MDISKDTVGELITILVETLGIQDRAGTLDASTPLFGSVPELDSLAVVEVITQIEERFNIYVDDDFSGDDFETIGSLAAFVDGLRASA